MYSLGIDIGSAFSKGVLLRRGAVCAARVLPSGSEYTRTAQRLREELAAQAGIPARDILFTIATGCGAQRVEFATAVRTDLVCHARGTMFSLPSVRTAIDVGDVCSKAFHIDEHGQLTKFLLSGKCAGGSGRILRIIAKVLGVEIAALGNLSRKSTKRIEFTTNCAVFAESEAVSRIAEETSPEDLVAGIHRALAAQINGLVERIGKKNDITLVGGGARDAGLVAAMEELTGADIFLPPEPQLTAALGAALIAHETVTA